MKHKFNLVIFDVDGVILDSEPLHYRAKVEILRSFSLDETFDLKEYVGMPNKDLWSRVILENHLEETPGDLEMRQFDLILSYIREDHLTETKGLFRLLAALNKFHICTAIASSSNRYYVDRILDYFKIKQFFPYSVTGDEVKLQKPHPDIYQEVLRLSGISKDNAIAIEDSKAGVQAAVSAGIQCLGYRNLTSGAQDLSLADGTIGKLDEAIAEIRNMEVQKQGG